MAAVMTHDRCHRDRFVMAEMDTILLVAVTCATAVAVGWLAWRWSQYLRETRRRARQDQLTGLMNDRAFAERAVDVMDETRDVSGEMIVLMYDIDGLGSISERFGREFGDFVVRLFAEKAKAELRADDLLFRLGADEFCSILPSTGERDARMIAERIRAAFSEKKLRARKKQNVRPTVSVGLASSTVVGFSIDRLKAAAEVALADAKQQGRDRLEAYRAPAGEERFAAA
jgi:diguanylate cyclase (GGDEF)-like protein